MKSEACPNCGREISGRQLYCKNCLTTGARARTVEMNALNSLSKIPGARRTQAMLLLAGMAVHGQINWTSVNKYFSGNGLKVHKFSR